MFRDGDRQLSSASAPSAASAPTFRWKCGSVRYRAGPAAVRCRAGPAAAASHPPFTRRAEAAGRKEKRGGARGMMGNVVYTLSLRSFNDNLKN